METCLYKGKQLCSFDLVNEKGHKNLELEFQWKRYADKKLLICEECKEIVYLRSGEKKIPHFYHKPNSLTDCSKKNSVSDDYLLVKKNLYLIFKKNKELFNFQMNPENKYDFQIKFLTQIFNIILKKIDELEYLIYLENMDNYYFYGDINR
ncbi:MAG: competence protein CoiA family protein, partial [Cetobacterium sp.]